MSATATTRKRRLTSAAASQEPSNVISFEYTERFQFTQLTTCDDKKSVEGRVFVTHHEHFLHRWRLVVYPKGGFSDLADDKRFGIALVPVDPVGTPRWKDVFFCARPLGGETQRRSKAGRNWRHFDDAGWGFPELFSSVEALRNDGFVAGDNTVVLGIKLTLNCEDFGPLKWAPSPTLTPTFGLGRQLFDALGTPNTKGTDFVLIADKEEAQRTLHVNQMALESSSPYFKTLFGDDSQWKENSEGILRLPEYNANAVVEALKFIYVNEIGDDLIPLLPSVLDLVTIWELDDFRSEIERQMVERLLTKDRLDLDTVINYAELADWYQLKVVQRAAVTTMMQRWEEAMPLLLSNKKYELLNQTALIIGGIVSVNKCKE